MLAPDLLATCKANDTVRAQDFLADGVPPGYSDPESGTRVGARAVTLFKVPIVCVWREEKGKTLQKVGGASKDLVGKLGKVLVVGSV